MRSIAAIRHDTILDAYRNNRNKQSNLSYNYLQTSYLQTSPDPSWPFSENNQRYSRTQHDATSDTIEQFELSERIVRPEEARDRTLEQKQLEVREPQEADLGRLQKIEEWLKENCFWASTLGSLGRELQPQVEDEQQSRLRGQLATGKESCAPIGGTTSSVRVLVTVRRGESAVLACKEPWGNGSSHRRLHLLLLPAEINLGHCIYVEQNGNRTAERIQVTEWRPLSALARAT